MKWSYIMHDFWQTCSCCNLNILGKPNQTCDMQVHISSGLTGTRITWAPNLEKGHFISGIGQRLNSFILWNFHHGMKGKRNQLNSTSSTSPFKLFSKLLKVFLFSSRHLISYAYNHPTFENIIGIWLKENFDFFVAKLTWHQWCEAKEKLIKVFQFENCTWKKRFIPWSWPDLHPLTDVQLHFHHDLIRNGPICPLAFLSSYLPLLMVYTHG